MRGLFRLGVLALLLFVFGGLVIVAIGHARDRANRARCENNLRQIGIALHNYASTYKDHLPPGTVPNSGLPPDRRLSWMTLIWPTYMEGGIATKFVKNQAWDAEENCPVILRAGKLDVTEVECGDVSVFMCPANASRTSKGLPGPTHFVAIAGVGDDAAELPVDHKRAGMFGYDRGVCLGNIPDGTSFTLMAAEVWEGGPWTAGGSPTLRALLPSTAYLGKGGQFCGNHRNEMFSAQPWQTQVLFGDGSVRPLTTATTARVFEALATINGGEEIGQID